MMALSNQSVQRGIKMRKTITRRTILSAPLVLYKRASLNCPAPIAGNGIVLDDRRGDG
jgi:hypothetical protein